MSTNSYLVGLIGDGITSSLTPPMHEQEGATQGLLYLYRPVDLTALRLGPDDVPRLLKAGVQLGFSAFNITHPVKQTVMAHLDEIDEDALALGAVNTVLVQDRKTIGYNTDHSGFMTGLRRHLVDPDLSHVVQLGTGGAGSAVAYALLRAGAQSLTVIDVDALRAERRAAQLQRLFRDQHVRAVAHENLGDALKKATGFVQCTPVGMSIQPGMPIDISWLGDSTWVSDVIYLPRVTELLAAARERGLPTADGGGMAVGQAVDTFRLITGLTPNHQRMEAHFQQLASEQQSSTFHHKTSQ